MKILLTSGIYPPDLGGPATYIPLLEKFLRAKNIDTKTITLTDGLTLKTPNLVRISRLHNKLARSLHVVFSVRRESRDSQYIFSNGLFEETALATMFMRKKMVMKVVGDPIWERFRNKTESAITIEDFQNRKLRTWYSIQRKMLVWSLNRAQIISTPSNQLEQIIANWGVKRPIIVIPNGTPCLSMGQYEENYDVIMISRLVSWKNIDCVIRALRDTDLRIGIAGTGPDLQYLEGIAKKSNNEVIFLGDLDEESVVRTLNQSKIYILNSDYEGLSFALINAMMLGKAIVVSNAEGNTQVISNLKEGLVVEARNESQIYEAVTKLLADNNLAKRLSEAARIKALENFCLEERLKDMLQLIIRER
jgi:glycosyltransferase involved in cell wall biosynthesis